MKLFLSSHAIPAELRVIFASLFDHDLHDVRIAYIPNAKDPEKYDPGHISQSITDLHDLGVQLEMVDLNNFREQPQKLKETLQKYDGLWVAGGNVFYLRYIMKLSGFDTIIEELVEDGLIYAGSSAGSVVAGPSLKYFDALDEPAYALELILEGLNLTQLVVLPHFDTDFFHEGGLKIETLYRRNTDFATIPLKDGQALVVEDEVWKILP